MKQNLTESSRAFWSSRTHAQHRHSSESWFKRYAEELLAFLPKGGTLLDVGCGACELTTYLAPHFERVVAVDSSPSMLAGARQRIASLNIVNINLLEAEAADLTPVTGKFDVILAFSVLQYLDQPALGEHLAECLRLLAPSGSICWGQVPNARLKWMTYLGLLAQPAPPLWELMSRVWQVWRRERAGRRRNDPFADGIGRWFDPLSIQRLAAQSQLECEFRQNWYYEYRFHALLQRSRAAAI